jgi:4'-phosphopantetheinyl transferase EntD
MPLFYQHNIDDTTKIGVWHIAETESFFLGKVPLPDPSITHYHKRLQHLAGRYLLQELFPEFPYHLIEIADTKKPFLLNEEYHFSVSHCGDYAAVIINKDHRVGIDIELVSPKIERIKHKFLNEAELIGNWKLEIDTNSTSRQPANLLTLLWSCKEAAFKWYGYGGVDFKKHIHLIPTIVNLQSGIIGCEFLKKGNFFLNIHYKFFKEMCLAWITTN